MVLIIVLAVALGNGLVIAALSTNEAAGIAKDADAHVARIQAIREEAAKLEETAPTNAVDLVDCIHSRVLRIEGLLDLTLSAQKSIRQGIKSDEAGGVDGYANTVTLCWTRAEKLLVEAKDCATSMTVTAAPVHEATASNTNSAAADIKITPRPAGLPTAHRHVVRTEETCLRQEQFAVMLGKAMAVKMTDKIASEDYIKALTRLAVEPLHGWQSGKCVTVDDVYVACARAMKLNVKDPKDPLSYGEALREEGLGVDTLLPERDPQLDPPYVLDSEVRALLTTGYAAPLPSSKRVDPD